MEGRTPTAEPGRRASAHDPAMDDTNRRVWAKLDVLRAFGAGETSRTEWWSDAGERAALLAIADEVRGAPILEVGVGGGRLIPMLRLLSAAYVGIDYTPEMVSLCHRLHPDVDIRLGDVRDLSSFADESFALVVFTFNGIDAIDHVDRFIALCEIRRVLRPGGMVLFSTHNRLGPCYRATPWRPAGSPSRGSWSPAYRLFSWAGQRVLHPAGPLRSLGNWLRLRRLGHDAGTWAIAPVEAHDFELLIHYTTFDGELDELSRAGFQAVAVFDAERGAPVTSEAATRDVRYFHFIARAAQTSPAQG
jgi:SAM-dependent methyltransferase